MALRNILEAIKQLFQLLPGEDNRTKIGPAELVSALVTSVNKDGRVRTLANLRRGVIALVGEKIDRSTFWGRLATDRLLSLLTSLVLQLMKELGRLCGVTNELLGVLRVKAVLILDSTSSTVPKRAKKIFPAPRKNVVPAAIKFHALYDLFGGTLKWFDLTPAKTHDRNGFPPLELLKGCLIIFDLGYWDYCLLAALNMSGVYFLSRVKANAVVKVVKVIQGLPKKKYQGRELFGRRLRKKKKKIIEVIGEFRHYGHAVLEARVIGFWNPIEKHYHWYVTNLTIAAQLAYPLYRIRWQLELIFKAAKSSLCLADQASGNKNIIKNLTLICLVAQLIGFAIGKKAVARMEEGKQNAFSFRRAAMLVVHIGQAFFRYLMSEVEDDLDRLLQQIKALAIELFDPNFRNRETSLQRLHNLAVDA